MKHVIVIETVDSQDGVIPIDLSRILLRVVEMGIEDTGRVCFVHGKFNAESAIAATHELYNAPKWEPNL